MSGEPSTSARRGGGFLEQGGQESREVSYFSSGNQMTSVSGIAIV